VNSTGRFPAFKQGIHLLFLFLVLQIGLMIVSFTLEFFLPGPFLPFARNLIPFIAIAIILVHGCRQNGESFRQAYPIRPFPAALLPPMCLALLGLNIIVSELDNLVQQFLPVPEWFADYFAEGGPELLFMLVILAPVLEELFFRGLMLRGFLSHYGAAKAILGSALLFAAAHFNPWQFSAAFCAGLLFGWWFLRTGSLLPCIIGHAVHNGLPFLLLLFQLRIPGYTEPGSFQPYWFDLLGVLLLAAGILLLHRKFVEAYNE
jgi:membrane protease YdiL (CAAX protease family)